MQAGSATPRVAVVGHVEWVQFARVPTVPQAGAIAHAHDAFEEPAGGGAVAAVQLARLAGAAVLATVLGNDRQGHDSVARLEGLGVEVWSTTRSLPTRRAITLVDDARERTIVTFGERLEPTAEDVDVPWASLGGMDAVYFTAGDTAALTAARAAHVLVASPRAAHALGRGVPLDALVFSAGDQIERREAERVGAEAALVVRTEGARGGTYTTRDGGTGSWDAAEVAGSPADSYGCGDSFAAGLTYGLGAGMELQAALALAARCGAACLTGHGPYEGQLTLRPAGTPS